MRYLIFGIVAGALSAGLPAMAKDVAFVDKCGDWRGQRFSVDERIEGCTATIAAKIYQGKDLARAYDNRGIAWSDKGDAGHAIADFDQAIKLDPAYAIAYFNRGLVFDDKGDFDRALADYDEAIRLNPDYAKAYNNRGLIFETKGDLTRAIADLDQAVGAGPENLRAAGLSLRRAHRNAHSPISARQPSLIRRMLMQRCGSILRAGEASSPAALQKQSGRST